MVQYQQLDRTFAALADPTRRAILERLGRGSATISELAEPSGMTLTGLKKHVRVLFDVAHYQQGGGDPAGALRKYRDWVEVLHLKDVRPAAAAPVSAASYRFVELPIRRRARGVARRWQTAAAPLPRVAEAQRS